MSANVDIMARGHLIGTKISTVVDILASSRLMFQEQSVFKAKVVGWLTECVLLMPADRFGVSRQTFVGRLG
jgi:hypothetical protein